MPKLDRLARSVPDARAIGDDLAARGIKLSLGGQVYDPADPMRKMFFNILATFAEFEVDLLRMRTREGMAVARTTGQAQTVLSPERELDTLDLRHGHVDLEIGSGLPSSPRSGRRRSPRTGWCWPWRPGHPLSEGELTVPRYAQAEHVSVSRRGRLRDHVDELLERDGFRRRVVATAPTAMAALSFVQRSDLVALVPGRMCRTALLAQGLLTRLAPLELPASPVVAAWHQRYDDDRAHRWLRVLVARPSPHLTAQVIRSCAYFARRG